jgi:hypothetical protein
MTVLLFIMAAVVVIAGAVVTIANPDRLPFHDYVQEVAILAGALGLGTGIGRGLIAGKDRDVDAAIIAAGPGEIAGEEPVARTEDDEVPEEPVPLSPAELEDEQGPDEEPPAGGDDAPPEPAGAA